MLVKRTSNTNITINGLKVGKTYTFKVQSVDTFNDVSTSAAIESLYMEIGFDMLKKAREYNNQILWIMI